MTSRLLVVVLGVASVASAQDATPGLLPEPVPLTAAIEIAGRWKGDEAPGSRDGFYPEFGQMITGAGWISAGPGYRRHLLDRRIVVEASSAISWRAYKIAQARIETPALADRRFAVGSQVLWQDFTQVSYFGTGSQSAAGARTDYRVQASDVVAYGIFRPARALTVTGRIGWLHGIRLSSSTGPFDRDVPDTMAAFSPLPGGDTDPPAFVHSDVAVTLDTRDHRGHPRRGGTYRAGWTRYSDRTTSVFEFDRYEVEAVHVVPALAERSVTALRAWAVLSSTADRHEIPFYFLPSLGGHNTLRGYADYRFHDRHLVVVNAESRWALFTHLDAAVFADAGSVAARAADLDLSRTSFGAGLRLHTGSSTLARFDAARGRDGWRLHFKMTDPLRLARLARHSAAPPFVP